MIFVIKHKEIHEERQFYLLKLALFSLFLILFSFKGFTQDSIPEKEDLSESSELKFQQHFFKALSQKAIGNFKKAIQNLENCNQILPQNEAVFFEFSKNYLELNKTLLAKEYINRAIVKMPKNIWMLKHLVKIYVKERNYEQAINIQQKIITINKKEREYLVRLFLLNRSYKKAVDLMNVLEDEKVLSSRLRMLKENLEIRKNLGKRKGLEAKGISIKEQFEKDKSYKTLKKILLANKENADELLKYSKKGIELFPAQPYVYLSSAKALILKRKYKNALEILQSGIDFVVDENMEIDFYKEMVRSYKGLGNTKQIDKYTNKIKNLKR